LIIFAGNKQNNSELNEERLLFASNYWNVSTKCEDWEKRILYLF